MRKRFVAKRNYRGLILKIIIALAVLGLAYVFLKVVLFKSLLKVNGETNAQRYLGLATNNLMGELDFDILFPLELTSPEAFMQLSFSNINITPKAPLKEPQLVVANKEEKMPLVYIYNTHQTEDYAPGNLKEYNITPTVFMAANMLKKALEKKQITAVVEEESLSKVLKANNWKYSEAYYASRTWLERAQKNYPSVKYFIDLHRDSVSGRATIEDVVYAKMMFVIGMNHPNYQQNEVLVLKLQNYLKENYPAAIKNIFYGRNSRYNQDFNINTILVEVGGPDNTIDEVYNSVELLAKALENVIGGV